MQSFGFGDHLVRAVERAGAAWFVANDVCSALEIGNSRQAVSRLDDDERDCVITNDAMGRGRETTIVSESGMYALIFTSRKEAAKTFRRWVTQEVLPAIRTTGRYEVDPPAANDTVIDGETRDELDAMRIKLALAREARVVFGARAARQAWRVLDLLPEMTCAFDEEGTAAAFRLRPGRQVPESVYGWMNARCEARAGHREWSMTLYESYVDWCEGEQLAGADIMTLTAWSRALNNLGIGHGRNSRAYRVGLRLLGASPA